MGGKKGGRKRGERPGEDALFASLLDIVKVGIHFTRMFLLSISVHDVLLAVKHKRRKAVYGGVQLTVLVLVQHFDLYNRRKPSNP